MMLIMHLQHAAYKNSNSIDKRVISMWQYDKKWEADRGFVFYDYKQPEEVPEALKGVFDLIVVDPPFITEEVWTMYTTTIRLLLKEGVNDENVPHGKMILTTLYENAEMMERLLGAKTTVSTIS